ncbi:MAG: bacillithiol biosynthesis deacetylase BshB1 [Candidatus Acidiferrales bacterium]
MKLDLLVIAAHPDDAELTSGGTLLKMADAGYSTGILDLTRGETGTRGTPETREKEAQAAAKLLNVKVRRNAGLPDAKLRVTDEFKVKVAEIIRELEPHTVILPYWEGRHPDHSNGAALGYEACFIAGLKNYPMQGTAYRPFKILYAAAYEEYARPTFALDITPYYEQRKRAILAYESQFNPPSKAGDGPVKIPLDELEERMSIQAMHFGRLIGVKYAEAYVVKETLRIDDVVKMPVASM